MSDINSETTTTPKSKCISCQLYSPFLNAFFLLHPADADTAASNSSNAQPETATTVHRSPQKSRQNHNHNHNHNTNHHGNHNSKNVNNNIGGGGGGGGGGRKRRYTVGVAELHGRPGYPKRTRRKDDDDPFEPPTVFKLGGNIHDPLNLNGIGANPGQTTPISSPFPSPFPLPADKSSSRENASKEKVEVLIPPNICDPLNLSCPNALNESDLISPTNFKSGNNSSYGRQRNNSNSNSNKRRRTSSETEVINEGAGKQQRSGSFHDSKLLFSRDDSFLGRRNTTGAAAAAAMNRANREKLNAERKISPVAATTAAAAASAASASSSGGQAGKSSNHSKSFSRSNSSSQGGSTNAANRNQNRNRQQGPSSTATTDHQSSTNTHTSSSSEKPLPKNNKERFRFGNYNRYYGYRNSQHCDRRLELLPRDLIQGKDVLDVGCNIGHVTLTLARDYGPRRIVGVDIDPGLIEVAKKNVRHYITEAVVQREGMPLSMPLLYGPLANMPKQVQGEEKEESGGFPNNVFFFALNYVPESDALLEVQEEEYDAIICLSLTKWIHLNWGDAGIRRLFLRAFRALRPGGCLILEPQPWSSYQKKAKLTVSPFEVS